MPGDVTGPSSSPVSGDPSGRVVVFRLFVALAIATAVALLWFATVVPAGARPRVYGALVLDLALPVIAWYAIRRINRQPKA